MSDWILIVLAVLTLWALWGVLNIVGDMLEKWNAARRGEDLSANKERERS